MKTMNRAEMKWEDKDGLKSCPHCGREAAFRRVAPTLNDGAHPLAGAEYIECTNRQCGASLKSARDIALRKVQAEACAYAHNLALMLWKQHYSDVAGWMPLPDLIGLLTQIDNMTAGLTKVERKCKHVFEDDRCVVCGGVA